ncbi:nucleotide-diphospho-sugar transferase [Meredithblackwellia eburnea MCA 4105]
MPSVDCRVAKTGVARTLGVLQLEHRWDGEPLSNLESFQALVYGFIIYKTHHKRSHQSLLARDLTPIHLVFTSSASYVTGLLALLNSTLSSSTPTTLSRLQFHVVSSDNAEARKVLRLLAGRFGEKVEGRLLGYGLKELGDHRLENVKVWAGYRSESLSKPIVFARYVIPSLLPSTIDRVIYLDQDAIVVKDLQALWEVDMEGYPVAAARLFSHLCSWRKQFKMGKDALREAGFDHDTCTLNNGVLVYDLPSWRTSNPSFADQLFHWTKLNNEDMLYSLGSQPPFNLVVCFFVLIKCFLRNYKVLDDKWNLMDIAGLKEETEYLEGYPWTRSREEVDSAAILHWNGELKPWMCGGDGYYSELWTSFFPDYESFIKDDHVPEHMCQKLVWTKIPDPPSVEKQFTVVIVSFMRIDTIVKIAKHLQHSNYVKEIVVAWNNIENPCPPELDELPWVKCFQQEANLVHNRFGIWPEVSTEAVLHYDDDLLAPIEHLEAAFQIWRSHPDQVVGFEPRVIVGGAEPAPFPTGCQYKFKLHDGYFDVVIGKLFFVSRTYMRAYFENERVVALSSRAPCEDIAMSFLAAHLSTLPTYAPFKPTVPLPRPPILFKSNLTEISSKLFAGLSQGISSTVWREERHSCVQELVNIFDGKTPGKQKSFFELDPVKRRVYKMHVEGILKEGWCSDKFGSRVCRQP